MLAFPPPLGEGGNAALHSRQRHRNLDREENLGCAAMIIGLFAGAWMMWSAYVMMADAGPAICTTVSVHDGDSLRCDGEKIRISNIDAPEMPDSSRCSAQSRARLAGSRNPPWCDHTLAVRSRDALRAFVSRGPVAIHRQGTDRYGRTLATVSVNGQDAGAYLVGRGLARPWQ